MAQGEAGNGCADEEVSPLVDRPEAEPTLGVSGAGRWVCGVGPHQLGPPVCDDDLDDVEADEETDPDLGRQLDGSTVLPRGALPTTCRTDLHGWAGAHRHGAVRPTRRKNRRQRPPQRWC
ncbi:hypothetical protein [Polymorphospora rubra]|uniref:Uncharacterized protein n=1 Tax=Polymorphospora rubra TaxID=338584 RepID=A0A810MVA1_9ACTN|nr:hypothetical protein [Polymorphospora rubra]BCJ63583.1 hypothetical protein Prubr_06040 [Polymorphospora rubra]